MTGKQYKKEDVDETNEGLLEMIADSSRLHDLKVVLDQKGGKMIVSALLSDVVSNIDRISSGYKDMSHSELQGFCASLEVNLSIVRSLYRAKQSEKELDALIAEELKQ